MPPKRQNRQAFVVQVQPGLDQMDRAVIDLQVDETLKIVIGTRFQFAIAPDIANAQ